ncbi:hypothetical protein PBI_DUMBO_84 [Mycobacterium phage Dumbo]|uniref:hypothetical protein n=1 Tax=Mycobacterium phage Dumbo TaxID=1327764 RepID=UPI000332B972|nr:hypothetical protein PBI_DUMBO_84 [Mycobacterium phage Dumbo]AGM12825.1 hypothetical protein PBI_DUMBO_84 [Mycobacterium phage Dumbo]
MKIILIAPELPGGRLAIGLPACPRRGDEIQLLPDAEPYIEVRLIVTDVCWQAGGKYDGYTTFAPNVFCEVVDG